MNKLLDFGVGGFWLFVSYVCFYSSFHLDTKSFLETCSVDESVVFFVGCYSMMSVKQLVLW